jgi:hypothetical protein
MAFLCQGCVVDIHDSTVMSLVAQGFQLVQVSLLGLKGCWIAVVVCFVSLLEICVNKVHYKEAR